MLIRILLFLALFYWQLNANAADLLEVYQDALCSDPIFKQVLSQTFVTKENVPISISYILPNINLFTNPTVTRYEFSGTKYRIGSINGATVFTPRNLTQRTYNLNLILTQPIFDFGLLAAIDIQIANAKSACATLNYALQNLMRRVSYAYFAILKDEDVLVYTLASKRYYKYQLDQIKHQFQVGLRTITDVYTAQASYDSSVAAYVIAKKTLANDRENLRVITGVYYKNLSYLKNNFPLVFPDPNNVNEWVNTALMQNWAIKTAQYSMEAAKQNINQQYAGHFPVITLESGFKKNYAFNIDRYTAYIDRNGAGIVSNKFIGFNIDMPLFQGGRVVAKTNQALYNFEKQQQIFEESVRTTINDTRQSFMNIVAGISQIKADIQTMKSAASSLQGTIASYNAGYESLIDVLNQEERLFHAQVTYASDRYEFVDNIILLKQAAGTLSFDDLRGINYWLADDCRHDHVKPFQEKLLHQERQSNIQQNKQKNTQSIIAKNQADVRWINMIEQIRQESKETYKKLEKQSQFYNSEIAQLKMAMSELKKGLQTKQDQLKIAIDQVNELKEKIEKLRKGNVASK